MSVRKKQVVVVEKEQPSLDGSMVELAREEERFHRLAPPEAEPLRPDPFAASVVRGLWVGALAGALLGLLFGVLLFNGFIVVAGWEGLFSMGNVTFYTFWTLMGVAAGILIIGIAGLLLAPGPSSDHS